MGLFGQIDSSAAVTGVAVTDAYVNAQYGVGILVGASEGAVKACWTSGHVRGLVRTGGLVGHNLNTGTIRASYSVAEVYANSALPNNNANASGGLVGYSIGGAITASYFAGTLATNVGGGVVGRGNAGVQNTYWDSDLIGVANAGGAGGSAPSGAGHTTADLQGPTGYGGIYAGWNVDLDGAAGGDDPWNFGTASQYPVLHYGGHLPADQGRGPTTDHDRDNDGLIDITTLAQLNAVRHDLNGNGYALHPDYGAAFPNRETLLPGRMGCPEGGCTGYELRNSLNFDSNGDGAVTAADDYPNWTPIGGPDSADAYTATFQGNGYTIANLTIDTNSHTAVGLFGVTGGSDATVAGPGVVSGLGLTDVDITVAIAGAGSGLQVGGLTGVSCGPVRDSYVTGAIAARLSSASNFGVTSNIGGLAGRACAGAAIANSRAAVTVTAAWQAAPGGAAPNGSAGGLVGWYAGTTANPSGITASSATGAVSVTGDRVKAGGLVGSAHLVNITAAYATGAVAVVGNELIDAGGLLGAGDESAARIIASYATGDVSLDGAGRGSFVGGLIGDAGGVTVGETDYPSRKEIHASYAAGRVSATGAAAGLGGLVALAMPFEGVVSASYWDTAATRQRTSALGEGKSTAALQNPTGYSGIYRTWNEHDLDDDDSPDAVWHFGDRCQYPVLEYDGLTPGSQRANDPPCAADNNEEYVAPPIVYALNIRFSLRSLTLDEGQSTTYRVRLSERPSGRFPMSITSNNPDVTVSPDTLRFTAADWNRWQTVTVAAARDANESDEDASLVHRGPNRSYGALIVSVNDVWPGATTATVNGHTVTMRHTLDAPPGVTVTVPDTLDADTDITVSGAPADAPEGAPGYGIGASAAARMLVNIRVQGAPADGLSLCVPVPAALSAEAGGNALTLLRYADGVWTPVAGAQRRAGPAGSGAALLCAAGVTEYGIFAAAYTLPPLGRVTGLSASPGDAPGTLTLTWTPGANATVHWIAGIEQSNPYELAIWTFAADLGSHALDGLESGAAYIFTVTAGRGERDSTQWSPWAPWSFGTPD